MDCSPPLVVSLVRERDNPARDDRRTSSTFEYNGYIALDGGEGRKRRGWLYTRLYRRRQGELERPCVRPRGRRLVCRTSTRRANETFVWQAVSVLGRLPVPGNARAVQI